MESVREKLNEFRDKQRQKGIASGQARQAAAQPRLNHGSTRAEPEANSPSPTPVSIKEKFNSLGELERSEKRFIEACELLFGEKAMENWGGKWRNNYRKNKANACSVLRQVCEGVFEGAITRNPSGYADKLWREYK